MLISDETIGKVREANDIAEVIAEFVPNLKRAGKDFKALCPFHQEKTASFMVSPAKGIFHCFGCGVGGDLFKFVMEIEHCSYPEAVRKLAERKGIPVQAGVSAAASSAAHARRKSLLQILQRAANFYHKVLLDAEEAEAARRYLLEKRQLTRETIEKFQLGWAPFGGQALLALALKSGCAESDLMSAGLIVRSQRDGKYLDWFRGRILFPILDMKGQTLGFGGRVLESQASSSENPPPKYLNSPETEVFQKGKNLYGFMHASRMLREKNEALVVEGYMDVIACHQSGVENAVAPLGTALTPDQCQLLKRYVERVTLLFDSDAAGQSASLRGAELLLEFGFLPMVARLPEQKDADEYFRHHSREDFQALMQRKLSVMEFYLEANLLKNQESPPSVKKVIVAQSLLPLLLKIEDEITRGEMLQLISERLDLSIESLYAEWNKLKKNKFSSQQNKMRRAVENRSADQSVRDDQKNAPRKQFLTAEEELLCLAAALPELREKLCRAIKELPEFSSDPKFLECLQVLSQNPGLKETGEFLGRLSAPVGHWLSGLLLLFQDMNASKPHEIFDALLDRIAKKNKEEKLRVLGMHAAKSLNLGGVLSEEAREFQQLAPLVKGTRNRT